MATSTLLLLLLLLTHLTLAAANLHSTASLLRSQLPPDLTPLSSTTPDTSPTTFFEVTHPIPLPTTTPCSHQILHHQFAYTYNQSPVTSNYTPPSNCHSTTDFSKIVLEWTATCKGRQFDRIFGVWLGGVELLRSCTAEPRAAGIIWTVKKDVTRYKSLLLSPNLTLAVYLGNLIDKTYTGVYNVNVTLHFYPTDESYGDRVDSAAADLIVPISRDLPLKDGLWFEIMNSTDVGTKEVRVPRNVYRAVLEVYVSFHENDEFWFGNFPNEYVSANNLSGTPGNGPFREVVVSLDDLVVGAVWPFTVIYTGGVNPLLWRPITGIGSFDLPSYDIEITPFLGRLLDGKTHRFVFGVTNALNVWFVDANLHLWLDEKSEETQGKLLEHEASPLSVSLVSNFSGFDGEFVTNVSRSIVSSGWVKSSHGVLTTKSIRNLNYSNSMILGNEGNLQILNQVINFNTSVKTMTPSASTRSSKSCKKFLVHLYSDNVKKGNGSYANVANVTLGVNENTRKTSDHGVSTENLKNLQKGQGVMLVKGNLVVSGVGSTQQKYSWAGDKLCYFRNISSSNYTILHDEERDTCALHRWSRFSHRRAVLRSKFLGEK